LIDGNWGRAFHRYSIDDQIKVGPARVWSRIPPWSLIPWGSRMGLCFPKKPADLLLCPWAGETPTLSRSCSFFFPINYDYRTCFPRFFFFLCEPIWAHQHHYSPNGVFCAIKFYFSGPSLPVWAKTPGFPSPGAVRPFKEIQHPLRLGLSVASVCEYPAFISTPVVNTNLYWNIPWSYSMIAHHIIIVLVSIGEKKKLPSVFIPIPIWISFPSATWIVFAKNQNLCGRTDCPLRVCLQTKNRHSG